jgi:hypothetical protein
MIAIATLLLVATPAHAIHYGFGAKCSVLTKDPTAFDNAVNYISGYFDALASEKHVQTPQLTEIPDIINVTCHQHPDFDVMDIAGLYARTMK